MREPSKKKSPPVSDPPETREDRRFAHNSLVPPIFQSATFPLERAADLAAFHAGELDAFFYSRYGNPTQTAAEARLARLEGAECSLLFASGMAAVSSVLLPLLAPGARLVIPAECYRHSRDFAEGILARYGVLVERLSENTLEALSDKAEGSVRVLFVEIPSNPTMRIPDLARLAAWGYVLTADWMLYPVLSQGRADPRVVRFPRLRSGRTAEGARNERVGIAQGERETR